jgi:hypothetical protein
MLANAGHRTVLVVQSISESRAILGLAFTSEPAQYDVSRNLHVMTEDRWSMLRPEAEYVIFDNPTTDTCDTRVLVIRNCYLALSAASKAGVGAYDYVVLVEEPGRALDERTVRDALGVTVYTLPCDPAIARCVDAGLLATRFPSSITKAFTRLPFMQSAHVS